MDDTPPDFTSEGFLNETAPPPVGMSAGGVELRGDNLVVQPHKVQCSLYKTMEQNCGVDVTCSGQCYYRGKAIAFSDSVTSTSSSVVTTLLTVTGGSGES